MDDPVEIVAEAIWRSDFFGPTVDSTSWVTFGEVRKIEADLFRDNARAAIKAIRAYDATQIVTGFIDQHTIQPTQENQGG